MNAAKREEIFLYRFTDGGRIYTSPFFLLMRGGRGSKKSLVERRIFFWDGFSVRGCGGFERVTVMDWLETGEKVVYT